MTYQDLVGRTVVTADGKRLGRVNDLVAQGHGGHLRVTELHVGPRGLLRRIAFRWESLLREPVTIPWQAVDRVDRNVTLRLSRAEVLEQGG